MAFSQWAFMRSSKVFNPMAASQASNGDSEPPKFFTAPNNGPFTQSTCWLTAAPPTTVPWPARYLVEECNTTSAPSVSGRWQYGVAKVLSTSSQALCRWAISATAARSTMAMVGLAGVSAYAMTASGWAANAASQSSGLTLCSHTTLMP